MFISLCYYVRNHYTRIKNGVRKLDEMLENIPTVGPLNLEPVDPQKETAAILVADFNGFGVHTLLSVASKFPNLYKNFIFPHDLFLLP